MKTTTFNIVLAVLLILVQVSCDNPSGPSGSGVPPEFRVLGIAGATKVYNFTVAEFIQGTQTPSIVPPDSLLPYLQFPESLYTRGVFVYGQVAHFCEFQQDTFRIAQTEQGFNLYSIIYNAWLHHTTNGAYAGRYTDTYVLADGNKIYQTIGSYSYLVYELPLRIGSVFTSPNSAAVTSIMAMDTIVTPAGTFPAFRVEVAGRWQSANRETHWVNPDVGPIISEYHYYHTSHYPWDTTRTLQLHQVQRRELVSIYY